MKELFVQAKHCLGCKSCEIACAVAHSNSKNLVAALNEKPLSITRVKVQSSQTASFDLRRCRHCKKPLCVDACGNGAISKTGNKTIIDDEKCQGCFRCVLSCPFGALNIQKDRRIVLVCDHCEELGEPACVKACPTGVFTNEKLS